MQNDIEVETGDTFLPHRCAYHIDSSVKSEKLSDIGFLEGLVKGVAEIADMCILSVHWQDVGMNIKWLGRKPGLGESGYSIVGIITTSHIAFHTWAETKNIMFDIVSCKPFNPEKVLKYLDDSLGLTDIRRAEFVNDF